MNLDFIYPVGSIYMSANTTNPSVLFGGTWTQLKDRFLLGAGDTYAVGTTGGEATHTLTVAEMPAHNHDITIEGGKNTRWGAKLQQGNTTTDNNAVISKGNGKSHNNMPPYLVVYMWKRTA